MTNANEEEIVAIPVRDLMTPDPILLVTTDSAQTAAEKMRGAGVGAVLVEEAGSLRGIVTDRDLVTRVIAARVDASDLTVGEVASDQVWTVGPDDTVDDAIGLMREHAVRRVPVVENGAAVGILALGDLAVVRDPESLLGEISAAEPND